MPSLITPAQLRAHVETGLTDAALQQIIDAEEAAIISRYGAHDSATEQRLGNGTSYLALARPAASILSLTEDEEALPPEGEEATDYYRLANPVLVERLGQACWGERISVSYALANAETARRLLVLVDLCKLQLAFSGYSSQGGADLSESPLDLAGQREQLLRQLRPGHWLFT